MCKTKKPVTWIGKIDKCQINGCNYNGVMFDACVGYRNWGNICQDCFDTYGCGLGIGKGQKYLLQPDGKWLLVAGGEE